MRGEGKTIAEGQVIQTETKKTANGEEKNNENERKKAKGRRGGKPNGKETATVRKGGHLLLKGEQKVSQREKRRAARGMTARQLMG